MENGDENVPKCERSPSERWRSGQPSGWWPLCYVDSDLEFVDDDEDVSPNHRNSSSDSTQEDSLSRKNSQPLTALPDRIDGWRTIIDADSVGSVDSGLPGPLCESRFEEVDYILESNLEDDDEEREYSSSDEDAYEYDDEIFEPHFEIDSRQDSIEEDLMLKGNVDESRSSRRPLSTSADTVPVHTI